MKLWKKDKSKNQKPNLSNPRDRTPSQPGAITLQPGVIAPKPTT